ncbi:MAG: HDOD domain-containing protein, partial [Candidatus Thiodiazotropha sp.]
GMQSPAVEDSLLAGMLHDIGKLILIVNQPTEYLQFIEAGQAATEERVAAEEAVFGSTHGAVGAYLLGLWGLPQSVVEAVALHNQPALQGERVFSVLSVVHTANALVHAEEEGAVLDSLLDLDYINSIKVTEERIEIWKRLASGLDANSN